MQDYIEIHSGSFSGSLSGSLDMQISQPLSSDAPARSGSGFYPSLRSYLGSTARNLSKVSRFVQCVEFVLELQAVLVLTTC